MISSQGTDCEMPFSVKSTDSGPIFTMSPVRTGPDLNLIQICLADFCSGDFLSALFCAGEQMLARNRTARDITVRFNGFIRNSFHRVRLRVGFRLTLAVFLNNLTLAHRKLIAVLYPKMRSFLWLVQIIFDRAVDQTTVKFPRFLQLR